jgi:hypothetical protein
MKFDYKELDNRTRELMCEEIRRATEDDEVYFSARFNSVGMNNWITWLTEAAESYDEHWLAYQIEASAGMKDYEGRTKPTGGYTIAHVPHTAAKIMAEGQFNRFYIAAVCRRSIENGETAVTVYRARQRGEPRPESKAFEGTTRNAQSLLEEVRSKQMSFLCDLLKPNTGLSVHL